jgi:hypothetical protein
VNKRNSEELKSVISKLNDKIPVSPTAACSVETSQASEISFVPATFALSTNDGIDSIKINMVVWHPHVSLYRVMCVQMEVCVIRMYPRLFVLVASTAT